LTKIGKRGITGVKSESRKRSIAKTLSYRVVIAALLALITYYYTGSPGATTAITVVFNLGGAAVYYGFERLWDAITWGRKPGP